MRRLLFCVSAAALMVGFIDTPDAAAQQSVNFFVGGFVPRAEDARASDDVLVGNLSLVHPLVFSVGDFKGGTVGGEWLVAVGNNLEAGLGIGFYQRSVPTVNRDFLDPSGGEIDSTLKLRIAPFSATIRFLPLGRHAAIQPYIGAGIGVFAWRYSESGDFLTSDQSIVHGNFVGSGADVGPLVLGGVRFPMGPFDAGGEIRYQSAKGTLPGDQGFAGSKIDLGGINYLFTFNVRF